MGEIDGNVMHDQKDICERLAFLLNRLRHDLLGLTTLPAILQGEAVRLQRGVSTRTPLRERAALALMLNNFGLVLASDGRHNEACLAEEEAILIRWELYRIRPSVSRIHLADSLYNYGINLSACERYEEACAADVKAIGLYKMLFEQVPDKNCRLLVNSLHNYGRHLCHLSRFEEARRSYAEALTFHRDLYKQDPDEHRQDLADTLEQYIGVLDDLGMMSEWRLAVEERKALLAEMKPSSSPNSVALNDVGRVNSAPIVLKEQETLKVEGSGVAEGESGEDSSSSDEYFSE